MQRFEFKTKGLKSIAAIFFYLTVVSLVAACSATVSATNTTNDARQKQKIQTGSLRLDSATMSYHFTGNSNKTGVLFIHGTPGDWQAFETYLSDPGLQEDYFLVSVDRLGWGESSFDDNSIDEKSINGEFAVQSAPIIKLLQSHPNKKWILVGHSLGASIAPEIALALPKQVVAMILIAGTLDPKLGKPRWYNRFANTWLINKLIGKNLARSNKEIMQLRNELELLEKRVESTQSPSTVTFIQGMKDKLVSPKNAAYVAEYWRPYFRDIKVIEVPKAGHFILWKQPDLVIDAIRAASEPAS